MIVSCSRCICVSLRYTACIRLNLVAVHVSVHDQILLGRSNNTSVLIVILCKFHLLESRYLHEHEIKERVKDNSNGIFIHCNIVLLSQTAISLENIFG